jgi:hypothetical protein
MRNYRPSLHNTGDEGERDPITIDIDIRYVRSLGWELMSSDDAPPIPLLFHPGGKPFL